MVRAHTQRQLEDVIGDDGAVDLDELAQAAQDGLVDLGHLTDEELHWLRDVDVVPEDDLEAPRLGRLGASEQQAALDAALCLLLARGDLREEAEEGQASGEPPPLAVVGRHALIAELREAPLGVIRIRMDRRDVGTRLGAAYRVTDSSLLLEDVDPAGIHAFVLASVEDAATWLAGRIDPDGVATATSDPVRSPTVGGLGVDLDELTERARIVTVIDAGRVAGDEVEQLTVTTYAAGDGVAQLQGWELPDDPGAGQVIFQVLGPDGVLALARDLVAIAMRAVGGRG